MSVFNRMSNVMQQKMSKLLDRAEDPAESLDFSYQKQLEALQQVRRNVADVLTSEKRLELQAAQLQSSEEKLKAQAQTALQQGREDLAKLALTRAASAQAQLDGLQQQITQMKDQESKLELMAQKLQAKVESFRTQKETIKAQYSAAQASTKIGEAVTGLSEQMADVNMAVERAQDKTLQMQARASAIDDLVASGTLDQIGVGSADDIDRQLTAANIDSSVDAQLAAMKAQLNPAAPQASLPAASKVIRIQGDDQYRLADADKATLEALDTELVAAINSGDEPDFRAKLAQAIGFVKSHGARVPSNEIAASDVVLPNEDTSLAEAKAIMAGGEAATKN